jgi:hypothetical protein
MLRKCCVEMWIGFMWLGAGMNGGILNMVMNKYYILSESEGA